MEKQNELKNQTYGIKRRNTTRCVELCRRKDQLKKVSIVLKKCEKTWTKDDLHVLENNADLVRQLKNRNRCMLISKERSIEKEDSIGIIKTKVAILAKIISQAKHLVCYTGAGISTSAHIPDYRGSNGIWTLLKKGEHIGNYDLSLANPTYTHMALFELYKRKLLRHIVSQNCDGLHLRSGFPVKSISEIHGNMYIEICSNCEHNSVYWRLFDTTEITARFSHKTKRKCFKCYSPLRDTIVHFGEKGVVNWPLNWVGACNNAEKADVILCLGSSLKVLKKYHWLWQMDRPFKNRAKVCILNLQWTPKDNMSTVKINGKCDFVMKLLMNHLDINVEQYSKWRDPIFAHATALLAEELHTVTQPHLTRATKVTINNEHSNPALNNPPCLSYTAINKSPLTKPSIREKVCINARFPQNNLSKISSLENARFPFGFDNSAYSGLKSIVVEHQPKLNMWDSQIFPIYQIKRKAAECTFCFDNYAELNCLFYKSWSLEVKKHKLSQDIFVFCGCCETSRSKNSFNNTTNFLKNPIKIQAGWYGKGHKKKKSRCRKI